MTRWPSHHRYTHYDPAHHRYTHYDPAHHRYTYYGYTCYDKVDDEGLHISLKGNPKKGEPPSSRLLEVDTVVVCAGQISQRELEKPLQAPGVPACSLTPTPTLTPIP